MQENDGKYYVYIIKNLVNDHLYIGETNNTERRWGEHIKTASCKSKAKMYPIHYALAKYGIDKFSFSIISIHETEKQALDEETRLIKEYRENNFILYNIADGGPARPGFKLSGQHEKNLRRSATKLSENDIIQIKELFADGLTKVKIAEIFSINRVVIGRIINGRQRNENFKGPIPEKLMEVKLSEDKVKEIITLYKVDGYYFLDLCERFNISESAIRNAILGKTWKSLDPFRLEMGIDKNHKLVRNRRYCKLSEKKIIEIRELYFKGKLSQAKIAKQYGIKRKTVSDIILFKIWAHVSDANDYQREQREDRIKRKLTKEDILEIRWLSIIKHVPYNKLIKQFNVSLATISSIVNYKTWKYL